MKRILIAPLDWGLGHATRCIPIIRELKERSCDVVLAGSGSSLTLLQKEFPDLKSHALPPYAPKYPTSGSMVWSMAAQLPRFMKVIRQEHRVLEQLIDVEKIDLVISDNRFGCWTRKVPCIFMTHQSNILMPKRFGWLSSFVRRLNQRMMNRFTRCWIPDYPGDHSLAGDLISFGAVENDRVQYIGLLSRFMPSTLRNKKYDLLCVFSGPEPQRTILEDLVMKQLENFKGRALVVRGVVDGNKAPLAGHAEVVDFMTSTDLQNAIESSAIVLARSGFSTIMDLSRLSSRAILIPTPGQTEQEYLAKKITDRGIAYSIPQYQFDLLKALQSSETFSGFKWTDTDAGYLNKAIDDMLSL